MSDIDMLKAAEAEVERLERDLEATPAYQKLQLAKKVVELYRSMPTRGTSASTPPILAAPQGRPTSTITVGGGPPDTKLAGSN